jgi:hypothetical protein
MSRRAAGPGSSPGFSTKKKTQLWNRLRRLDAKCASYTTYFFNKKPFFLTAKDESMFKKYDLERKEVRTKLKSASV